MKIDALTKTSTSGFSGRSSSKKTKRSESFNESGVQSLEDKKKDGEEEKNIQGQPKENQSIDNVKKVVELF